MSTIETSKTEAADTFIKVTGSSMQHTFDSENGKESGRSEIASIIATIADELLSSESDNGELTATQQYGLEVARLALEANEHPEREKALLQTATEIRDRAKYTLGATSFDEAERFVIQRYTPNDEVALPTLVAVPDSISPNEAVDRLNGIIGTRNRFLVRKSGKPMPIPHYVIIVSGGERYAKLTYIKNADMGYFGPSTWLTGKNPPYHPDILSGETRLETLGL